MAWMQVHIFNGRQPFDFEILQPPEMQALPHHGMDAAVKLFLFIRIPAGAIGEMHAGHAMAVTSPGGGSDNAPDGAGKADLIE